MSGTPDNLGVEEEAVGMPPEELDAAKKLEDEPMKMLSPVSGKRKPPPPYEKYTLSVTFFTAISLPWAVLFGCFIPWGWGSSFFGMIGILLDLTLGALILWSLISTYRTDPFADPRWIPRDATEEELQRVREKAPKAEEESVDEKLARAPDYYDAFSYCTKCQAYKPPRCHHCRHCGRCTLVYDHHCGWVSACIGYSNHKQFVLFLIYSTLLVLWSLASFFKSIVELLDVHAFHVSRRFVLCAFYLALLSYLVLTLLKMLREQLIAIKNGENIVESVVHLRVRHYQPNFTSPYDRGLYGNWKALMGEQPYEWFLPIAKKPTFSSPAYVLQPSISRPKPFYAGVH